MEAVKEGGLYQIFYDHPDPSVRREYASNLPKFLEKFNEGMNALEGLMREHIEGTRLGPLTRRA